MATNIAYNRGLARSQEFTHLVKTAEQDDYQLERQFDIWTNLLEGDGTDPTHFVLIVSEFGFESNARAKLAYELLKAMYEAHQVPEIRQARRRLISRLR